MLLLKNDNKSLFDFLYQIFPCLYDSEIYLNLYRNIFIFICVEKLSILELTMISKKMEVVHQILHALTFLSADDEARTEIVGALAWYQNLKQWPLYDDYMSEHALGSLIEVISADTRMLGSRINMFPKKSPLETAFNAGIRAIPKLVEARKSLLSAGLNAEKSWTGSDDLPIEINLGSDYHFHSILSCPIQRQQTTRKNPIRLLKCRHVISNVAVEKLVKTDTGVAKVKCPYCPVVQQKEDIEQIYL